MTLSRRQFLGGGLGMLTLGIMPPRLQRRIGIAVVGLGEQGLLLLDNLLQLQAHYPLEILALADVQSQALDAAASLIPNTDFTMDYEVAITRHGVNTVVIATPDASHAILAEAALKRGYDLYVEPPLARDSQDVQKLGLLAVQNKAIIQLGLQDMHDARYTIARRLMQTGLLGKITRVEVALPAPKWRDAQQSYPANQVDWHKFLLGTHPRPFNAHLLDNWALFSDFSDGHALQHLSRVTEILHYMLDVEAPQRIIADGGNFIWQDGRTNPDSFQAVLTYPAGFMLGFSMGLGRERFILYGTQGSIDLIKREVFSEDALAAPLAPALARNLTAELAAAPTANTLNAHLNNWLAALQYRKPSRTGIAAAYRQAVLVETVRQAQKD
jgi:predicted dehydrogenase